MLLDIDQNIDNSDNNTETIYFNNDAQYSDDISHSSRLLREDRIDQEGQLTDANELWGAAYPFKPVAQEAWDDKVRVAAVKANAVEVHTNLTSDPRPRAYD